MIMQYLFLLKTILILITSFQVLMKESRLMLKQNYDFSTGVHRDIHVHYTQHFICDSFGVPHQAKLFTVIYGLFN